MSIINDIKNEVSKVIVGQNDVVELSLISLIAGGHVLLEGVPGTAKTLFVSTLSKVLDLDHNRVSFTPDLMPSDITGTNILNMKTHEFELAKGPVFTNLFLADELNRTPPKTQSGLLEAMAEEHITIDGQSYELDKPFMVFATQNPLEYEGTYPLSEALLDRFLMKIFVGYPSPEEEIEILRRHNKGFHPSDLSTADLKKICTKEDIINLRKNVDEVFVEDNILRYIASIISATRNNNAVQTGASPRGAVSLLRAGKAFALLNGRDYVLPEDIKRLSFPILRHRLAVKPELELEGFTIENVLMNILAASEVPR